MSPNKEIPEFKLEPIKPITNRDPKFIDADKSAVRAIAQAAINVELFTIPLYMTALYSIQGVHQINSKGNNYYKGRQWPGAAPTANPKTANEKAFNVVFSVFVQEMLHLQMAANIAKAIGVEPKFNSKLLQNDGHGWICYGDDKTVIPHIVDFRDMTDQSGYKDVKVKLDSLNEQQLKLFLAIEEPLDKAYKNIKSDCHKNYFPKLPFCNWKVSNTEKDLPIFGSIGYLYHCYAAYLSIEYKDGETLWDKLSLQRDMFNHVKNSGHSKKEFPGFSTSLKPTLDSVIDMMKAITDQGEGSTEDKNKNSLRLDKSSLDLERWKSGTTKIGYGVVPNKYRPNQDALRVNYPSYNENGHLVLIRDEKGYPVQFLDEKGNPVSFRNEKGYPVQARDKDDNLFPIRDKNGNLVKLFDEKDGNLVPLFDKDGKLVRSLDEDGKPVLFFDEKGKPVSFFDEDGKPVSFFDEDGNPVPLFDEDGNLVPLRDEKGNPVQALDENGELRFKKDGKPVIVSVLVCEPESSHANARAGWECPIDKEDNCESESKSESSHANASAGLKCPHAEKFAPGDLDHFERFEEVLEMLPQVVTWDKWHEDPDNEWNDELLTTDTYKEPTEETPQFKIPSPEDVAGALNRLKQADKDNKDNANYKLLSQAAVGAIAGITTVLDDYWQNPNKSFPYPSMVGSGDRVSICWAIFGKVPDLSQEIGKQDEEKLYHACQGLNLTSPGDQSEADVEIFHSCKGSNQCKAQGGCGFAQLDEGGGGSCNPFAPKKPKPYSAPGDNKCKTYGGCAVPISASQLFPQSGKMKTYNFVGDDNKSVELKDTLNFEKGDSVYYIAWEAYRKVLEARGVESKNLPSKPEPSDLRVALPPST